MVLFVYDQWWGRKISGHLKTQEICNDVMRKDPWVLKFISDHFKTQGMCNQAVGGTPMDIRACNR